jgi:hypothetical protein
LPLLLISLRFVRLLPCYLLCVVVVLAQKPRPSPAGDSWLSEEEEQGNTPKAIAQNLLRVPGGLKSTN